MTLRPAAAWDYARFRGRVINTEQQKILHTRGYCGLLQAVTALSPSAKWKQARSNLFGKQNDGQRLRRYVKGNLIGLFDNAAASLSVLVFPK
jgi:hypothetical protein